MLLNNSIKHALANFLSHFISPTGEEKVAIPQQIEEVVVVKKGKFDDFLFHSALDVFFGRFRLVLLMLFRLLTHDACCLLFFLCENNRRRRDILLYCGIWLYRN